MKNLRNLIILAFCFWAAFQIFGGKKSKDELNLKNASFCEIHNQMYDSNNIYGGCSKCAEEQ